MVRVNEVSAMKLVNQPSWKWMMYWKNTISSENHMDAHRSFWMCPTLYS